mgnify:CR=1 FL=1
MERQMAEIFENKESIQMELETSELLEKEFQRRIQQLQKEVEQKKEKEAIYLKSAEAAHLESAALDQKIYFAGKCETNGRRNVSQITRGGNTSSRKRTCGK